MKNKYMSNIYVLFYFMIVTISSAFFSLINPLTNSCDGFSISVFFYVVIFTASISGIGYLVFIILPDDEIDNRKSKNNILHILRTRMLARLVLFLLFNSMVLSALINLFQ